MNSAALFAASNVLFALTALFSVIPILIVIFMPEWRGVLWVSLTGSGWLIAGVVVRSRAQAVEVVERDFEDK